MSPMNRRSMLGLLGGVAASRLSWPLAARAQQPERMRRIGMLLGFGENEPEGRSRIAAFRQGMQELGWAEGRNLQIEYRWATGIDRIRSSTAEMVALGPDVIIANATPFVDEVHRATRSIPVVFVLSNIGLTSLFAAPVESSQELPPTPGPRHKRQVPRIRFAVFAGSNMNGI